MDFFVQVNERLLQPPEPKSELRAYFEAHLLFQGEYHSPPTSPETSPEPEERPTRPTLSHRGKKRKHGSDDEGYTSGSMHRMPSKRRRGLTPSLGIKIAPSPPVTDDSLPQSPTRLRRVETQDSAFHEDEQNEKDAGHGHHHGRGLFGNMPMSGQYGFTAARKRWRLDSPPVTIYGPQGTTRKTRAMRPASMKIGRYSLRWTAARARRADG